ncbi:hypothetical protein GOODEAATRI_024285 [Goodea atripinnis]|uniref:Uncharacterized protein n=1 Tax=Goodea atripinnis TaxID=208336 RepID=A0ABV0N6A8_9TELE
MLENSLQCSAKLQKTKLRICMPVSMLYFEIYDMTIIKRLNKNTSFERFEGESLSSLNENGSTISILMSRKTSRTIFFEQIVPKWKYLVKRHKTMFRENPKQHFATNTTKQVSSRMAVDQ